MPLFPTPTLLHNPACSKSRAAKALLVERGFPHQERRYLEAPLSREELAELRRRLGLPARDWTRTGEAAFRDAGLGPDSDEPALLDAMARQPILIERPILILPEVAAVGRPVERIAELLDRAGAGGTR